MRRNDRAIVNPLKMKDIINRCVCCRIGFNDDGAVYIVPLSFGFEITGNTYVFYFHGAKEGRKLDLIQKNPKVGFEMDTHYALNESEHPCSYSARFQSVIGNGVMSMVTDVEEKRHGLSLIMEHTAGKGGWIFDEKMVNAVAVFKLEVTEMSCKEHQ